MGERAGNGAGGQGDTGSGASAATLDKLFQPRTDPSERTPGTTDRDSQRLTTLESQSDSPRLSAAEQRLQEALKRIESERKKRADAASIWRPNAARRGTWKDW